MLVSEEIHLRLYVQACAHGRTGNGWAPAPHRAESGPLECVVLRTSLGTFSVLRKPICCYLRSTKQHTIMTGPRLHLSDTHPRPHTDTHPHTEYNHISMALVIVTIYVWSPRLFFNEGLLKSCIYQNTEISNPEQCLGNSGRKAFLAR